MLSGLKKMVKKSPIWISWKRFHDKREVAAWKANGQPVPPPHYIKRTELKKAADRYGLKILVETGTFMGDMVAAMKPHFGKIYSIELSKDLYEKAKKRFENDHNVVLINGDSGSEIAKVIKELDKPALFWLDGHYSSGITAMGEKDTPILEELSHILSGNQLHHVIFIDDARLFGVDPDYPTIEKIIDLVKSKRPEAVVSVAFDSIRIAFE